ncbi:MAG: MFS transporter, partial [Woeseiaceae bacterium]
ALILVYLTSIVKLEPYVAGMIVFGARIVDAFCDPLMGWITDRTSTRIGRRRPYLLLGAIACGLTLPLVYSIHVLTDGSNAAVIASLVLILYSIAFTIFNVPYLTMPVEMTTDRTARIQIMGYRVVFMMIGGMLGNAGAPYLIDQLGGGANAFQQTGMIAGGVIFLFMLIAFLGTSGARAAPYEKTTQKLSDNLRSIVENKPFMTLIGVKILQFIAIAAVSSTIAFYVTVVLKQDFKLLSVFGITVTATIVVAVPIWKRISNHITKLRGFVIGIIGEVLSSMIWLIATPEISYEIVVARAILAGIFGSAILLNSQAMWLDTIDYDYRRTGLHREGMFTSIYVFVERLGYSVGPLALGALLSSMGFDKTLPLNQQPESAELAVYIGIVWIPAAMYTLALLLLTRYKLPDTLPGQTEIDPKETTL